MANYHENVLAITADEENMCKVLFRMGMNLAANREYTNFDLQSIEGLETAEEIYRKVGPEIDGNYIYVFAGAPVPKDIAENETPGWTSGTSSEGSFAELVQAMVLSTERFNKDASEGASLGLTVTKPAGCGLSDTASVGLTRYGGNLLLEVCYATAWSPNSEDLDAFCMGLPQGDYGIAFYDGDEYNSYSTVDVFSGLHHGCATMHAAEGDREWDTIDIDDLKARRRDYSKISGSEITDIVELARMGATRSWSEWGEDANEDYLLENVGDDGESIGFHDVPPTINWIRPTEDDFKHIDKMMLEAIGSFPQVRRIYDGFTTEGNEAAERLFPGENVTVVSEWSTRKTPCRVSFKVCDSNDTVIGTITGWTNDASTFAALACILPHLKATVWKLVPLSLRSSSAPGPLLSVRFDLEPIDAKELIAETHALLKKSCKARSLSSKKEDD